MILVHVAVVKSIKSVASIKNKKGMNERIDRWKTKSLIKRLTGRLLVSDLKRWKQTVKLTPEQIEDYLRCLDQEIAKRAEVIVGGGHRKYYHKVA